jgi:CheY-like chemotaxis protein
VKPRSLGIAATPEERFRRERASGMRPRVRLEGAHQPLVLLVDDDEDCRALYGDFLAEAGARIEHAVDGEHALLKVAVRCPDLVITDVVMPSLDGWEVTRQLKAHPKTLHVPVLVLTSLRAPEEHARARRAGADHICIKPCEPSMLVTVASTLLGRAKLR